MSSQKFSKLKWEIIEQDSKPIAVSNHKDYIRRAKVYGGWLVESVIKDEYTREGIGEGLGITFVPDPKHEWALE
ncbi:MAG TPA: hypothetical protein VMX55_12325 [candidate division Zixibacteria bacterium]|nr:hypothetical protein [candidate division Zixibacteria bacterium]